MYLVTTNFNLASTTWRSLAVVRFSSHWNRLKSWHASEDDHCMPLDPVMSYQPPAHMWMLVQNHIQCGAEKAWSLLTLLATVYTIACPRLYLITDSGDSANRIGFHVLMCLCRNFTPLLTLASQDFLAQLHFRYGSCDKSLICSMLDLIVRWFCILVTLSQPLTWQSCTRLQSDFPNSSWNWCHCLRISFWLYVYVCLCVNLRL